MKRLLSCILALVMLFSMIPFCFATEISHIHPVCGCNCSCASYNHGNITWQAWDGSKKMITGYYYLEKDIVLDDTMVLDYSYTSYLCLNGHSITCQKTVFDIYSYRSLIITDCKGTGKIETTDAWCTISNNKFLNVWDGTILNSRDNAIAIIASSISNTYIHGGKVEGSYTAIDAYPGCNIQITGGIISGEAYAITGPLDTSGKHGTITISGGTITSGTLTSIDKDTIDVSSCNFTMSGGNIDGFVIVDNEEGTTTISGGTISQELWVWGKYVITGGNFGGLQVSGNGTISAGTFRGDCLFWGQNNTVSGGNFSGCEDVKLSGDLWICGGCFNSIELERDSSVLYLSGKPDIGSLLTYDHGTISAQDPDGYESFGGNPIDIRLSYFAEWNNGDIVIKDVNSDTVALKFALVNQGENTQWKYLERSCNSLVLRFLPLNRWDYNTGWEIVNDTLIVSGYGEMLSANSGIQYPWGNYANTIKKIIVESGITSIPPYAFESFKAVETIVLPETLTELPLNAFNDCDNLNNLLLPSSLASISGNSDTGIPTFIHCKSLTDMYYLGTAEEWSSLTNGQSISSSDSIMTLHFLQLHETKPTCTEEGIQAYYQFDKTDIYKNYYDRNKNKISSPVKVPVDPTNHVNITTTNESNSSCSSHGYTAGVYCNDCKKYLEGHEGKPLVAHTWNEGVITPAPTCTKDGVKTFTCTVCGATKTEAVSMTGHAYGAWTKLNDYQHQRVCANDNSHVEKETHAWNSGIITTAATCTKNGVKTYTCTVCSATKTETVRKTGHSYGAWAKLDDTQHQRVCANDNTHVEKENHKWNSSTITSAATCTKDGVKTYTCTTCNATKTGTVNKTGHNYGTWTKLNDYQHQRVCANDNSHVEKENHRWNNGAITTAPTCTTDGVMTCTCTVCGATKTESVGKTGHSYGAWTKLNDTQHQRICTNDNTHVEKENHVWNSGVITTAATCNTTGVKTYTCTVCSTTKTETIAKNASNHVDGTEIINAKAATCAAAGYTGDSYCKGCGAKLSSGTTIDKTINHTWDNGKVTKAPTCTTDGVKTYTCTVCGAAITETVSRTGHSYGAWTKLNDTQHQRVCANDKSHVEKENHAWNNGNVISAATCTTDGVKTLTCTVCKATKQETIIATGHYWLSWTKLDDSQHKRVCSNDPTHVETAPHTWDNGQEILKRTCTATGIIKYTCTDCRAKMIVPGNTVLGHSWSAWEKLDDTQHQRICANNKNHVEKENHKWNDGVITTAATCTKDGVKAYTCTVCNATKTEDVGKTGHNYGAWTKLNDTQHQRVCANDKSHVEKENHKWNSGVITTAATCTKDGVKTYTCTVCNATKTETVGKTGHSYGAWTKLNDTQHQRVCANDKSHVEKENHKWNSGVITTAATCTKNGVKTYTCTVCNATKMEAVNKTGHNYGAWTKLNDTQHQRVCANDKSHVEKENHKWDNGIITTAATCTKDGIKTFTCTVCSATKTETVGKTGHDYSAWTKLNATQHQRVCANDKSHVEKENHKWDKGIITTAATCTKDGVKTYTCNVCQATKTETVKATGHKSMIDEAVAATCTADGKTAGSHCSVCGEILTAQTVIKAAGHQWDEGSVTTAPTCVKDGVKTYTCAVCGETKTESVPSTGEHTYGEWTETKAATLDAEGEETRTCSVCGAAETRAIPKLVPVEPERMIGDVDGNGKIEAADARLALRASVGLEPDIVPGTDAYLAGDADGDGKVTSADARLILRASVGLEDASKFGKKNNL